MSNAWSSRKTVWASSNETQWMRWLVRFFRGSHSNRIAGIDYTVHTMEALRKRPRWATSSATRSVGALRRRRRCTRTRNHLLNPCEGRCSPLAEETVINLASGPDVQTPT